MKKIALLSGVAALCTGCVTAYAPPTHKVQPTVRVDTRNIKSVLFFEQGKDCSFSRKLEKPFNPHLEGSKALPVRGNKMIAFKLGYATRWDACSTTLSFVPKLNHDYVIYNKLKHGARGKLSCIMKVIRKHRAAGATAWLDEETHRVRQPLQTFSTDAPHCR